MQKEKSRQGLVVPQRLDSKTAKVYQRPVCNTAGDKQSTPSCGHHFPIVRNVVEPNGGVSYLCRACYSFVRAIEVRTITLNHARRELSALFGNHWPQVSRPGAFLPAGEGAI